MAEKVVLEAVQHQAAFVEFCRLKLGVGGPDVHMKTAGYAVEARPVDEALWRLSVYNSFCSTPPAAAVWARWSHERVLDEGQAALEAWIKENWAGIPVRKNRRPARSPAKLARCLYSVADYLVLHTSDVLDEMSYEEVWKSLDEVYTWGRYVKIKFLETLRRSLGYSHLEAPDIRAAGGWSPRRALAYMYPEYGEVLRGKSDAREALKLVHAVAAEARESVSQVLRRDVSFYELEALLCNYRQTCSGTFYVGRTIDSELEYHRKVEEHFGADPYLGTFDFFAARRAVFPEECLGEVQGWDGVRKDLWTAFSEYGLLWSDREYSYLRTVDLEDPVRR